MITKKVLGLGVFALLTGGILFIANQFKPATSTIDHSSHGMSHDEMMAVDGSFNPTPVTVAVIKPTLLEASVKYTGTIEPYQVVTVYPRVAGQLTDYSVYTGDRIVAGQTLAHLSANELLTEVAEAEAETDTMRTALEVSRMEVLEQKNVIQQIEADLSYLNKRLARFAMLVSEGAIAQDQYDIVESEVSAKKASLAEAKTKLARLEAKVVNDMAKIQQSKAKVATASVMKSYSQITSPLTGIVQERLVDPGMVVQPGMGIVKIGDYSRIRLQANVAQQDAVKIRLGSPIIAKIVGTEQMIRGQVTSIFPQTNSETRTVTIEALVNNPDGKILSGQFIEMEIITERQPNALMIPQSALMTFENNPSVWIVEGETARRQQVELGKIDGDRIQVTQGLKLGDAVITTGHHNLIENAAVKVINQESHSLIVKGSKQSQDNVIIKLVSPSQVKMGDAQFTFEIQESKTQKPINPKDIEIKATMPMKNMAPMTAEVEIKTDNQKGRLSAEAFLGMTGKWNISVQIKDPKYTGKETFEIEIIK